VLPFFDGSSCLAFRIGGNRSEAYLCCISLFLFRDTLGKCYFLRVEITLQGATYHIAFSDTDQLPPPFRIDNFSKVKEQKITFFVLFFSKKKV